MKNVSMSSDKMEMMGCIMNNVLSFIWLIIKLLIAGYILAVGFLFLAIWGLS